jgi:hypothetical protein
VIDSSVLTVIELLDVALISYFLTPTSEHNLTNRDEVLETIMGLKFFKAPNPNGICNSFLKKLPQLLFQFINAVLIHHFLQCENLLE